MIIKNVIKSWGYFMNFSNIYEFLNIVVFNFIKILDCYLVVLFSKIKF